MLMSLADDVILTIFEQAAGPAVIPWLEAKYEHERAVAPFALASVCRRWRDLMRSSSVFWTYFGFPHDPSKWPAHLSRLDTLIALSKNTPVDVILIQESPSLVRQGLHEMFPASLELTDAVLRMAPRWRNAAVTITRHRSEALETFESVCLQEECPYLKTLALSIYRLVRYLPVAPVLSRLHLECDGVGVHGDIATQLPSLTSLSIYGSESDGVNEMCYAFSQQLVELCIVDDLQEPPHPLVFPKLRSLTLDDPEYLAYLQAPLLRVFVTNASNISTDVCSMLPSCASVEQLQLYEQVTTYDCLCLQLPNVSRLTFGLPKEIRWISSGWKYKIVPGTFLEANLVKLWPRLQRIDIGRAGSSPESVVPDELLAFIANRNSTDRANLDPPMAKLLQVVVDYEGMPEAFQQAIQALLGPNDDEIDQ
ncbi:hypothetical protein BKA62DRAFT_383778 [Auriculariales sp. MPI-PUGE-AT-0066]|nr:hypothetical protein BKA62DRAFT_383778 [Auriculariales sp. MPI-PUGE-AT-0066]